MATYPSSGSLIGSSINSGLSTQITIKVGPTTVGAVQKLIIDQSREVIVHEEIGTDGFVDSHPKGATKISASIDRTVFDGMKLPEAFARGFINIQAQRIPFDIEIIDRSTNPSGQNDTIVHTIHNCWFKSFIQSYIANDFVIVESSNIVAEKMTTSRAGLSAVNGGLRGIRYYKDSIERTTDVTGRTGRWDTAGQNIR